MTRVKMLHETWSVIFFSVKLKALDSSRYSMSSSLLCTFCTGIASQASSFWQCLLDFVTKREKEPPTFTGRGRSTDVTNGQTFLLIFLNKNCFYRFNIDDLVLICSHFYSDLFGRHAETKINEKQFMCDVAISEFFTLNLKTIKKKKINNGLQFLSFYSCCTTLTVSMCINNLIPGVF